MLQERRDAVGAHVGGDRGRVAAETVVEGGGVAPARVPDVAALAVEHEEPARLADGVEVEDRTEVVDVGRDEVAGVRGVGGEGPGERVRQRERLRRGGGVAWGWASSTH